MNLKGGGKIGIELSNCRINFLSFNDSGYLGLSSGEILIDELNDISKFCQEIIFKLQNEDLFAQ